VYGSFGDWRKKYGRFLKIGVFLAVVCIMMEIVINSSKVILITKLFLLLSGVVAIKKNTEIIAKS
jgi:hypothetical protein